ncbi:MAG: thiamine pyrophosphokinase [Candidatus Xenobia bacterium]
MKVAILAAGVERDPEYCRAQLQAAQRILCADAGYRLACELGVRPDAVVGDFDSLTPEEVARLEDSGIPVHRYPPEKDQSDLELALDLAASWGAREVVLLAALEGRLDHLLFNLIAALEYAHRLRLRARLLSSVGEVFLVHDEVEIAAREGWTASFLSLEGETTGITLEGFRYPLVEESLLRHHSRGLSNVVRDPLARVRLRQGVLLAVLLP